MHTRQELFYLQGTDASLPTRIPLRAGPLTASYEDGTLRRIRLGDQDVLLMIYAAVRDHNWGTIPGVLSDVQINTSPDSFEINYRSIHQQGEIDFTWHGAIIGQPDGTIQFTFDGQAGSIFRRNRVGFCVLHPQACAGLPCQVKHSDSSIENGRFPERIEPHQPFKDILAIRHPLGSGLHARVSFRGDIFEMEDQRNWTDASYKTYCTPLELPYPVGVHAGDRIWQSVTLQLIGIPPHVEYSSTASVQIQVQDQSVPMPEIGLTTSSSSSSLTPAEAGRLRSLRLSHLRCDIRLGESGAAQALDQAAAQSRALSTPLVAALHMSSQIERELEMAAAWARRADIPISRWVVFRDGEKSTSTGTASAARKILGITGIPIGGGTDAFFTQLNRERPPVETLDFITYSVNPQVHAFDHASLVETLAGQAETVRSAGALTAGLPIHVGPVTLKMRSNPDATGPEAPTPPGQLPRQVDPRQMSLFGAGWTLGSIKSLAEAGAASLTYFTTTGWLGVMETAQGSPLPDRFPSIPGSVFPMFHIFASIGEFAPDRIILTNSSDRLKAEALLLAKGSARRLLLANYTAEPVEVYLPGIRQSVRCKVLDSGNVFDAARDPETFRAQQENNLQTAESGLNIRLLPFACAQIDS